MISRKAHKRICRMNNRLRGERQMLRLSVRALSGNPLKETERRALAKRQAFIESLKGSVEERLAKTLEKNMNLEERVTTLKKVPRIVRWLFRAK